MRKLKSEIPLSKIEKEHCKALGITEDQLRKSQQEYLKGEILLYIGSYRTGPRNRYKMHQFICKGEKCHIRCHNFRYLEKI